MKTISPVLMMRFAFAFFVMLSNCALPSPEEEREISTSALVTYPAPDGPALRIDDAWSGYTATFAVVIHS